MDIYCLSAFKEQHENLSGKKHYHDLGRVIFDYFHGKSIRDLLSGTRLNNSDDFPYIKKRLKGRGGYRLYFLLLLKDDTAYLMFVHPKTGPDGADNITKESKARLYKKALAEIPSGELYKVRFIESEKTINIENVF